MVRVRVRGEFKIKLSNLDKGLYVQPAAGELQRRVRMYSSGTAVNAAVGEGLSESVYPPVLPASLSPQTLPRMRASPLVYSGVPVVIPR